MTNALEFATVQRLYRTGRHTIIFSIDLDSHRHLRDPQVVKAAMDDFAARYPKVHGWQAEITEFTLYITVVGYINDVL